MGRGEGRVSEAPCMALDEANVWRGDSTQVPHSGPHTGQTDQIGGSTCTTGRTINSAQRPSPHLASRLSVP